MTQLINLKAFRASNHIRQADLASFLGVSRAFINQIENNNISFPAPRLKDLLERGPREKGWNIYDLVPAYGRILRLYNILLNDDTTGMSLIFLGSEDDPFDLDPEVLDNIKLGKVGITEPVIKQILEHFPYINRYWLEKGDGNVYRFLRSEEMGSELPKEVFRLRLQIDSQSQAINRLENNIAELLKKMDSLCERIVSS